VVLCLSAASSIHAVPTTRTKAIITMHLTGWPCHMNPILHLANEHGINVIEDFAEA